MKFSSAKHIKIIMIGAGGTGGHIAPHLYRLLYALDRPVRVIIADGDIVEPKNLVRQNFIAADLGRNKAQVLAERYASAFGMEIEYIPEFIESKTRLANLVMPTQGFYNRQLCKYDRELVILIGAVDNNRSRRLCHSVFKESDNLVYIDSGNGEYTGQVVCGIKRSGRMYYKPIGDVYPDVLEITDKFPTQLSCAEASVSAPQSIVANVMAATIVVSYIYNILVCGEINVRSATFSSKTMTVKPLLTVKRKRRAIVREKAKLIVSIEEEKNYENTLRTEEHRHAA